MAYSECKYGSPLGRRPGRVAWKWGYWGLGVLFWQCFPWKVLLHGLSSLFYFAMPTSFVFLNATRRDRNCPRFASKGKKWIYIEFAEMKEVSRRSPRELKFVRYIIRLEDLTKSFKWRAYVMSGGIPIRLHAKYLPQGKEKLLLRDILCVKRRSCLPPPALYSDWIARSKYYVPVKSKLKNLPGQPPAHLNFWKIFVQIPPLESEKLFKCPITGPFQVIKCPTPGKLFSSFFYAQELCM